jgi:hypothetical protein
MSVGPESGQQLNFQMRVAPICECITQIYEEPGPYAIGQEFVMFLRWQSTQDPFARGPASFGVASAFAIQNGLIHGAGITGYVGMSLDAFLAELQALSTPH